MSIPKTIIEPLWRDGYHAAARYIEAQEKEIKKLRAAFLEICCEECVGDDSVGVPSCPFYQFADIDVNGKWTEEGCTLKMEEEVDD